MIEEKKFCLLIITTVRHTTHTYTHNANVFCVIIIATTGFSKSAIKKFPELLLLCRGFFTKNNMKKVESVGILGSHEGTGTTESS